MSAQIEKGMDYSTILASSIHDMKNSLGFLLGSLDMVGQQCRAGQCNSASQISRLHYEGKRVNDHLVQLLALYRMENSQFLVEPQEYCLEEYFQEIMLEHVDMLDLRNISWRVDCDADLHWFFDGELLSGVLRNIINNLYLYGRDEMLISAGEEDSFLCIRISDNGKGYPEQLLSLNENPAGKLDFRSGGTGLGLYFATQAARLHRHNKRQGFIQLSNDGLNGGGCFSIYLP